MRRYEASVAVLREALQRHPDDAASHHQFGTALWDLEPGNQDALAALEEAVRLQDYFPYHYRLGIAYLHFGRFAAAEEQFRFGLVPGAHRHEALAALGDTAAAQGSLQQAADYFRQAIELHETPYIRGRLEWACEALTGGRSVPLIPPQCR